MKGWRLFILVALLALGALAVWLSGTGRSTPTTAEPAAETPPVAYDYKAQGVVVRQMGTDGRLEFQIEAQEITQLPDSGRITATNLTMFHDPVGSTPGGPNRWTLTADNAELPAAGGIVTLRGKVRGRGRPPGSKDDLTLATDRLRYDLGTEEVSSDSNIQLDWGTSTLRGSGLKANIRTGELALESDIHGTFSP